MPAHPTQRAVIEKRQDGGISVTSFAVIDGVEYRVGGFGLGPHQDALSKRLARAIEAGVVYTDLELKDCDPAYAPGQKWVRSKIHVIGRKIYSDLSRLGF